MAAVGTGSMLILNLLVYKEPPRPTSAKPLHQVLLDVFKVLLDYRFVLMIVLYSGFWVMYFQMFDTVLWYLKDYVDMSPVNAIVNKFLGIFTTNPKWEFDAEHVTVISSGCIILLQLLISNIVRTKPALPTMIKGISLGVAGMAILSISSSAWVFLAGLVVFSLGEMTAHPKFISYVGLIAPPDKKALYQGYSFLYGVIGSGVGGILGASLYVHYADGLHKPGVMWLIFCMIGIASIIGLLLFNRFLKPASDR
jgi:dipeptide/tripeptide permease